MAIGSFEGASRRWRISHAVIEEATPADIYPHSLTGVCVDGGDEVFGYETEAAVGCG